MTRWQLEHVIEEVGRRTGLEYFYIIGAAAVLAELPDVTAPELTRTRDVDVVPGVPDAEEEARIANQIDWVLGEGSDFEIEYEYYAQGLSQATPQFAPEDWMMRARPVRAGGYTGLCMEIHDLAMSKFGAGRPKDLEFNRALVKLGVIDQEKLFSRLDRVQAPEEIKDRISARIKATFKP